MKANRLKESGISGKPPLLINLNDQSAENLKSLKNSKTYTNNELNVMKESKYEDMHSSRMTNVDMKKSLQEIAMTSNKRENNNRRLFFTDTNDFRKILRSIEQEH